MSGILDTLPYKKEDDVLNNTSYDSSIVALLQDVRDASDLEGVAILELNQEKDGYFVSASVGVGGLDTVALGHGLLVANSAGPTYTMALDKRSIMACPWVLPPGSPGGLLLWRKQCGCPWAQADQGLAAALAVSLRTLISRDTGQIGIDRQTGLPNRRWFLDEVDRHIDRLDLDDQVGTLCLVDIDDLRRLNALLGRRDHANRLLAQLGNQLRATIRPGDLLARVGGEEFAVWQNGMDHLTAAERADALCAHMRFPELPPGQTVTVAIGIASRRLGSRETVRSLLGRARRAAREVKGQGGWRVSHPTSLSRRSDPPA
ncbi:GGDEF domain-containing protein [Rhodopila sp.]|uniref:GGDEF domain-containing protein n=1 Tax=Rhodopila sp. TaxID=2480087 RepID=UPI003D144370